MQISFRQWLIAEDDTRTGAKLGLYPSLADSLGQYPPLYLAAVSADFITYSNMFYPKYPQWRAGILDPNPMASLGGGVIHH
jgi:hypothetical protein